MKDYQNLSKDLNLNQAAMLAQILEDQQIPHLVDPLLQSVPVGDMVASNFEKQYSVWVKQEHYLAAVEAMGSIEELTIMDEEHPFDSFSDEELLDVYHFPEEWNTPDYEYAKQLIKERNIEGDFKVESLGVQEANSMSRDIDDGQEFVNQMYRYASDLYLKENCNAVITRKALMAKGLEEEKAAAIVSYLQKQTLDTTNESGSQDMIYGALWCIGGIIATVADFGYIFWGAIVFGGYQFFKGATKS